jgi:hypothetical protein
VNVRAVVPEVVQFPAHQEEGVQVVVQAQDVVRAQVPVQEDDEKSAVKLVNIIERT